MNARTAERLAIPIHEQLEELEVALVTDVAVPEELNDRAADSWETLLIIAEAAGEDWPMLGRQAALALSADDETEVSIGIRLLSDIRDVLESAGAHDHATPRGETR